MKMQLSQARNQQRNGRNGGIFGKKAQSFWIHLNTGLEPRNYVYRTEYNLDRMQTKYKLKNQEVKEKYKSCLFYLVFYCVKLRQIKIDIQWW
jgi:hypothetical protein